MDIVERLKIVLEGMEGGCNDWPVASQIYEYREAIKEIETLRSVKNLWRTTALALGAELDKTKDAPIVKEKSRPSKLPFKCTDCGHVQHVSVVYDSDGSSYFGSGANWCDQCDGKPELIVRSKND
jgi:hypothetical protein